MRYHSDLETDGVLWVRSALNEAELCAIEGALKDVSGSKRVSPGHQLVDKLISCQTLRSIVESAGYHPEPVRIVTFDKRIAANWGLPWHQDRVVAVKEKETTEGVSNWSCKNGVWHCEPPLDILQKMIFIRLHLDPVTDESGGLEILPGTHKLGYIAAHEAAGVAEVKKPLLCLAERGDVLILKALTLHRSLLSSSKRSRRAIRLDYAATDLPGNLSWAFRTP